jgi:hypothetical protein
MSTRNIKIMFLGSKAWWLPRADNFATICEPIVYTMGSLISHNSRPVTGIAFYYSGTPPSPIFKVYLGISGLAL